MIALIEYGNGASVPFEKILKELNVDFKATNREADILEANKIIFPGLGQAKYAMSRLHLSNLFTLLRIIKKPTLAVSLGMELLCERSKEGNVAALGIFSEIVVKLNDKEDNSGWYNVKQIKESALFSEIEDGAEFYFTNSYYVPKNKYTTSTAKHCKEFSASIEKNNFYGVQFRPESSGEAGIKILKNFIERC